MKHSNRIISLIVFTVSLTTLLSGCSLFQQNNNTSVGDKTNTTETNITLQETPAVTKLTFQIDQSKLPEGFALETNMGAEGDNPEDVKSDPAALVNATIKTPNDACLLSVGITYGPSYQSGWGDDFITKDGLWGFIGGVSSSGINKTPLEISYKDGTKSGTVEALSASWNVAGDDLSPKLNVMVAVRSFDAIQSNGYDPVKALKEAQAYNPNVDPSSYTDKGPYGSDSTKGLPSLQVYYNCTGDTLIDTKVFDQVVNSITVQGITKK